MLQLASDTMIIGTLASRIVGSDPDLDLPEGVEALLVEVRDRTRERNVRLMRQLGETVAALNMVGVEPIVMKGMARLLSNSEESGRIFSDIDLLVPESRRNDCIAALACLGYSTTSPDRGHPRACVLARSSDVGTVDLHTVLQPYYLHLTFDKIAELCRRSELESGHLLLPDPTGQLLMTIVHDQLHDGDYWRGFIDTRHILDIGELTQQHIDWDLLTSFFSTRLASNALHVHLLTAQRLLGIDLPKEHCGGIWAALQLGRRKLQLQLPILMPFLTFMTFAADPPPLPPRRLVPRHLISWIWGKMRRSLRPVSYGKAGLQAAADERDRTLV